MVISHRDIHFAKAPKPLSGVGLSSRHPSRFERRALILKSRSHLTQANSYVVPPAFDIYLLGYIASMANLETSQLTKMTASRTSIVRVRCDDGPLSRGNTNTQPILLALVLLHS